MAKEKTVFDVLLDFASIHRAFVDGEKSCDDLPNISDIEDEIRGIIEKESE